MANLVKISLWGRRDWCKNQYNCNILEGERENSKQKEKKGFGRIMEILLVLGGTNMGIHFDINHSGYFSFGVLQFSIKKNFLKL